MNTKTTGEYIAKKRKEKNVTQQELADLLNVTNKAVSRWETGEGFPDVTTLPQLAKILGVTTDEILEGKDIFKNQQKNQVNIGGTTTIICLAILIFTIISIIIAFSSMEEWYGVIIQLATIFITTSFYVIKRNQFISQCQYTERDKLALFISLNAFLTLQITCFSTMIPLYLSGMEILFDTHYSTAIITFEYFIDLQKCSLYLGICISFLIFIILYAVNYVRISSQNLLHFILSLCGLLLLAILGLFIRDYHLLIACIVISIALTGLAIIFRKKVKISFATYSFLIILSLLFISHFIAIKLFNKSYYVTLQHPRKTLFVSYVYNIFYVWAGLISVVLQTIASVISIKRKENPKLSFVYVSLLFIFTLSNYAGNYLQFNYIKGFN